MGASEDADENAEDGRSVDGTDSGDQDEDGGSSEESEDVTSTIQPLQNDVIPWHQYASSRCQDTRHLYHRWNYPDEHSALDNSLLCMRSSTYSESSKC
jgi:hypothetical protein